MNDPIVAVSIDLNDPIVESEDEVTVSKSHPSKNYSKLVLYDKWKAASKAASTYKKQITEFQKESLKDSKEIEKLCREVRVVKEKNEKLMEKVEDLGCELSDAKKAYPKKNGKKGEKVSDSERIANMRATFQNLQEKKEYEHKSVLCDLELKYSEMELQYNSKVEKIGKLEEELKDLKKNSTAVNDLKVASLKSEIQIRAMEDKVYVR